MVADWPLRLPSLLAAASLGGSGGDACGGRSDCMDRAKARRCVSSCVCLCLKLRDQGGLCLCVSRQEGLKPRWRGLCVGVAYLLCWASVHDQFSLLFVLQLVELASARLWVGLSVVLLLRAAAAAQYLVELAAAVVSAAPNAHLARTVGVAWLVAAAYCSRPRGSPAHGVTVRVYVVMLAWFEFGKRDSLESLRWISSRLGTDLNYSTRHPHVTVGSVAAISLSLSSTVLLGFWLVVVGPTSRFE